MHLVFRYEVEKEFLNLQSGNKSLNRSEQSDFSKKLETLGADINSSESVTEACTRLITKEGIDMDERIRYFSEGWQQIGSEVFMSLIQIFDTEDDDAEFIAYLSLNERCSYNTRGGYFFLNLFGKEPNMVCIHELLHLFTHKHIKLNIEPKKYNNYKEALTVLINLVFNDLIEHEDRGYPQHKTLREFIAKSFHKDQSIPKLTKTLFADENFTRLL